MSWPRPTPATPRRARVLVVEDNPVNRRLIERQLIRIGHDCEIVELATVALDLLADDDHGFDVVLMDRQLPELDGLAATRRLRAIERPSGRRVPLVAVTASVMPGDRAACMAAGMDDFLAKPVSVAELAAAIARWSGTVVERA